jgi:diaminopimelate epimerase
MRFSKYHALGNDYLVMDPVLLSGGLGPERIRRICHRNYGAGSDGILFGPLTSRTCDFGLRIFNPDGSEAEKSGNGLRIFARFLQDEGLIGSQPFTVETLGGRVTCQVEPGGRNVTVEMGEVSFDSSRIPVTGSHREVLNEELEVGGKRFVFCDATVGNPHCIILCETVSREEALRYGPLIEVGSRFPNRTNVQFMQVLDRENIRIEIWERGAGYTLASGSSSTAAAAAAYRLGKCGPNIAVHMPGGIIRIRFEGNFHAVMSGPVTRICRGELFEEMFE